MEDKTEKNGGRWRVRNEFSKDLEWEVEVPGEEDIMRFMLLMQWSWIGPDHVLKNIEVEVNSLYSRSRKDISNLLYRLALCNKESNMMAGELLDENKGMGNSSFPEDNKYF